MGIETSIESVPDQAWTLALATRTSGNGTVLPRPGQQCFGQCIDAPGTGQLCVSLGGKTACVIVDAAGDSH